MNPAQLLTHFDRISEAPDAVARLREFILELAVRGKLVAQDSSDEPVSELLRRIQAERIRLVKEGKIRQQEAPPQVEIGEQLFGLPTSWEWVRFGGIADFSAGRTPSRHDFSFWNTGDYPWVSIADMVDRGEVVTTKETVSEKAKSQVFRSEPAPVDTMIMSFKLTIGKISRLGVPAFHNEAIISIRPHLPAMHTYLFAVLPQFSQQGDTKDAIKGATLNRDSIANILLPIPPLAEQHRIVAKVDELMALCNGLEAVQAEREGRRDRLAAASLHRLNQPVAASDGQAFREHASFHLQRLPRLTTRPEHIKQLRQTILSLAVRGQLVPQDPDDQPATDLLRRIAAEKARLEARGVIKKSKPLPPLGAGDAPFDLPLRWQWCRLRLLAFSLGDGLHGTPTYVDGTKYYFINGNNLVDGRIVIKPNTKTVSFDEWQKHKKLLSSNTILVSINGTLGSIAFYDNEEVVLGKSACYFNLSESIDKRYIRVVLESSYFIDYALQNATGTTIKNLSLGAMNEFPVPLPPEAEQHRIVAKVDELMALCDQLEAQLTTAQSESRRLLESMLHHALKGQARDPLVC